jgi:hypothetical protein
VVRFLLRDRGAGNLVFSKETLSMRGRAFLGVSILGCLLLGLIFVLWADCGQVAAEEPELLLNRLVERGILTSEEATLIQTEERQRDAQLREEAAERIAGDKFELPKPLQGLKVGILGYLDFSAGEYPEFNGGDTSFDAFRVTRGYLTVEKDIAPFLGARVTGDARQTSDGDWNMRLKYYYAELRPHDLVFLTDMKSEWGMGHVPWLDFEEHVNPYRCQGTMAVERAGVFNSADLGVSVMGYNFGKLHNAEQKIGSKFDDGYWGSWHVGVYNGPGYHDIERNCDKPIEGRLTLRPLPEWFPGLQLSYFGLSGKGNTDYAMGWPDYTVNLAMLSYQLPWMLLTGQYFTTQGNAWGTWVDAEGNALTTSGYSFFGNQRLPFCCDRLWWFVRYDYFDQDVKEQVAADAYYGMWITGLAYYFNADNLVMVCYEGTDYGHGANRKGVCPNPAETDLGNDRKVQVVLQVKF